MYKYALTFIGGIVVGVVASKLYDRYETSKIMREITGGSDEPDDFQEEDDDYDYTEVPDEDESEASDNVSDKKDYTSYTEKYAGDQGRNYIDSAKKEHPEEDDTVEEQDDYEEIKKYKKPRLIKESEAGELSGFEQQTLKYWTYDDVLTTEENEELRDQEYYVGDCMIKFGFKKNSEEREIYVRNSRMATDYCIVKYDASFAEWKGDR